MSDTTHMPVVILYKPSKNSETTHSFSGSSLRLAESMIPEAYSNSKRSVVILLEGFKKLLTAARCAQADLTGMNEEGLLTDAAKQTLKEISIALDSFTHKTY